MSDLTPRELVRLVLDKISELGDKPAQEYFDVSAGTIHAWKTLKTFPSIVAAQKVWDETLACQTPEIWGKAGNVPLTMLLPIYGDMAAMNHITLFANYRKYGIDKINIIPRLRTLIDEARNDLAAKFLATKGEWAVFCDDDSILPTGNAAFLRKHGWNVPERLGNRVALERLMSHPKEYRIVGALYRDRKTGVKAQCERAFRTPQDNARLLDIMAGKNTTDDGLEENGWVGTGLIRIHRSVFEEMAEAAKPGGPLEEMAPPKEHGERPMGFFGRSSRFRGEDVAMGRRAAQIGIKSYVDCGLYVGHKGEAIY
jgi:hypothetical protein